MLGKYRIERVVGTGGMGVVAECTHLALDDRVALKMLRQDIVVDVDTIERFKREGKAAAKLKSEYVAHVYDVGELENGTPFMVMEFLEGHDLGELIMQRGHLPVPWATQMIVQTCEALAEAHSIGIVHRDVKPTNLFVTWRPDGTSLIKVLDFGISKATNASDMHLTQTQSLLGTPAYMSPEQMRSARTVDARTDIWSLGTVLYELLEGRKPFEAESFSEMCVKVAVDPPAPMRNVPPRLAEIVMRCLAKSPEQRFASMAELGRELMSFTQDPQQAAVSVERMQRMLRRSQDAGWEGAGTGAGLRASTPYPVRDAASTPVHVPFGAGTEPSGVGLQPWHGGSDSAAPMFRNTPFPTAVAQPSPETTLRETTAHPPRKRGRGWLALALVLLAGGGVALAVGVMGRGASAPPITSTPSPLPAAPAVPPPATPPPTATTPQITTETPATAGTPAATEPTTDTTTPTRDKPPVKTGGKTGAKSGGKTGAKSGGKTVPKAQPQVEVKAPKVEPCDPFANAHGCKKSK